jgi:hypothetical protein
VAGQTGSPRTFTELVRNRPLSHSDGAFPRSLIEAQESVLFETHPSLFGRYWAPLTVLIVFTLLITGGEAVQNMLLSAFSIGFDTFMLLMILLVLAFWRRRSYALTSGRILAVSGLVSRDFQQADYDAIQNLSYNPGSAGSLVFDMSPPDPVPGKKRRSTGTQRITWKNVSYTAQVYQFVQDAFKVQTVRTAPQRLREALLARAMQNMITCPYCHNFVDIRTVDLATGKCPRCGAPLLQPTDA